MENSRKRGGALSEVLSAPSSEAEWVSLIKKMQETGGPNPDDSQLPRKDSDWIAMFYI